MLLAGALIGILAGLLAQPIAHGLHGEISSLARFALLLPGIVFVGWWLLMPGIAADGDDIEASNTRSIDVDKRLERIESTFDTAAVPRTGRFSLEPPDPEVKAEFQRSIRRSAPSTPAERRQFGLYRHLDDEPPAEGEQTDEKPGQLRSCNGH